MESELESLSSTLEELSERMSAWEPSALERMATLLSRGIVRIVSIIKALSQFWFREDLVRLVDGSHLGF